MLQWSVCELCVCCSGQCVSCVCVLQWSVCELCVCCSGQCVSCVCVAVVSV